MGPPATTRTRNARPTGSWRHPPNSTGRCSRRPPVRSTVLRRVPAVGRERPSRAPFGGSRRASPLRRRVPSPRGPRHWARPPCASPPLRAMDRGRSRTPGNRPRFPWAEPHRSDSGTRIRGSTGPRRSDRSGPAHRAVPGHGCRPAHRRRRPGGTASPTSRTARAFGRTAEARGCLGAREGCGGFGVSGKGECSWGHRGRAKTGRMPRSSRSVGLSPLRAADRLRLKPSKYPPPRMDRRVVSVLP